MNTNNKVETTVIGIDCLAKGIDAAIAPYTFGIPVVQLIENFVTIGKNIYDNRLIKKILELFDNTDYKDEKHWLSFVGK